MPTKIPEPWLSFIRDVDQALGQPVTVHCLGGFVLCVLWGLPRPTGDVDFIEIEPSEAGDELLRVAGAGSGVSATVPPTVPQGNDRRLSRGLHVSTCRYSHPSNAGSSVCAL